jgi:hypothetical protein
MMLVSRQSNPCNHSINNPVRSNLEGIERENMGHGTARRVMVSGMSGHHQDNNDNEPNLILDTPVFNVNMIS